MAPLTATVQQYSLLTQAKRPEPQRVRYHHATDLLAFVQSCQRAGELVAVMGDFNNVLGEENSGLTKLCSECGLKDIVYQKHNISNRDFNTYSRGTSCIDYMLLDSELADAVEATGYEAFNIRFPSDHRGMYVDVNTRAFFGSTTQPLPPMALCDYCSKNIHQTEAFINEQAKHLQELVPADSTFGMMHCYK